jgi:uncharacterized protein YndB with AHSA1/START domain
MEREIAVSITIFAPAREVWNVLTEADQIPLWWEGVHAVNLTNPEPGGIYTLDYERGDPHRCEILQSEPGKLLRYRWISGEPGPTEVEYRLESLNGATRLHLHNRGYGKGGAWDRAYDNNLDDWAKMLAGVRRLLESAHGA